MCLAIFTAACVGEKKPEGWASPAVDGPTAFVFEKKDRLTALNLQDNAAAVRWSFPDDNKTDQKDIDLQAVYGEPVLDGDTLYIVSYSGELLAIDPATGDRKRRREIDGSIPGALAFDGGQLAFGTIEGRVFLVNASDFAGVPGWDNVDLSSGVWATPVLTRDRVFVATMEGEVVAFERATGNVVWRFQANGAAPTLARLDDNNLFVGTLGKEVFVLDPADGRVKVEFRAKDWVWNAPAFKENVVYFGDFSGNVYALDITTGREVWNQPYEAHSKVKSGPVIIDDVLVIADRKPIVHFVRLADGTGLNQVLLEDVGTIRATPTVRNGKALIITTEGYLFSADPKAAPGAVSKIPYGSRQ